MTTDLIITDEAQAQLDEMRAALAPQDSKIVLTPAQVAADAAIFGDIIETGEPVSGPTPAWAARPPSRKLLRRQAQAEVRAAVKHFRKSRLERARADVAGLPDDLRNRSYAPDDLRAARAVLPKEAGLLDVLTEAARIADQRTTNALTAEVTAAHAATDLAEIQAAEKETPA